MLREALMDWALEALEDAACLVLSELVTNAVHHAGTAVTVTVRRRTTGLRLEVTDSAPTRGPVVRDPDASDEHGRGLILLDTLASSWGSIAAGSSKTMWC